MKHTVRELLSQGHCDDIGAMALGQKRVLACLVSLTFDPDPQIAWRAVEALGVAAGAVAKHDPEYVRNHLRRLYWFSSEESGAVCWRAPEAMAEIVRSQPLLFADYVPIVVSLLTSMADEDLEHFRPGILWAIGRLGPLAAEHIPGVLAAVTSALRDPHPRVRGMAAWCLAQTGHGRLLAELPEVLGDETPVEFYADGLLHWTSVGELARQPSSTVPKFARVSDPAETPDRRFPGIERPSVSRVARSETGHNYGLRRGKIGQ